MNNLQLARDHVVFHHNNSDGWITLAQKDPDTGRFKQRHYKPEELADHLTEWTGEDVYFSQNTFYKPQRRIDTIRQLRSLYVDLDVYTKGYKPEWVLGKLEYEVFRQTLPEPNLVIFSGRGLVLVWNIEPIPYAAMPLWRSVETYLINQLKELGADSKSSDPARIFRIAGSINSKNGVTVKAQYRHDHRYDIHQIQYDYLPELAPKKLNIRKPGRKTKVVRLFNIYTLHLARARDIAKLIELRQGDVGPCREYICFLYRYFTCCYTEDPQQALTDTLSLNDEFTHPLSRREVIQATKSAERAWKESTNKKANELAIELGYPGAGYNITNNKLIEWLDITAEEMMHLSTIINKTEKRRRERIAITEQRRQAGIKSMEEYNEERKVKVNNRVEELETLLLHSSHLSNRQLAKEMNISEAYIRKLKKKI